MGAWMCVGVLGALIAKQGDWVLFGLLLVGAWVSLNLKIDDTPQ